MSRYKYNIPYFDGFRDSFQKWMKTSQGIDHFSVALYANVYKVINLFFPKEQIKFLMFEDIKNNMDEFMRDFYKIIELDKPKNFRLTHKNKTLTDAQLKFIFRLNRFKIFKKGGFLSRFERRIIKKTVDIAKQL